VFEVTSLYALSLTLKLVILLAASKNLQTMVRYHLKRAARQMCGQPLICNEGFGFIISHSVSGLVVAML